MYADKTLGVTTTTTTMYILQTNKVLEIHRDDINEFILKVRLSLQMKRLIDYYKNNNEFCSVC